MKAKTAVYFNRLKELYGQYEDNDSLMALAEISEYEERARTLKIYREQPKTKELIDAALTRYKNCIEKLTNPSTAPQMSDYDRALCFATMDWAIFTLDIVGETVDHADKLVDDIVLNYAQKAGVKLGIST